MSRNYKFHNPEGVYFVSFAVIDWLDVFTRNEYEAILVDSLRYCQLKKGMEIFAIKRPSKKSSASFFMCLFWQYILLIQ
ncbi:MAG: hypothetical protein ACK5NK_13750 [Niabella sp.]